MSMSKKKSRAQAVLEETTQTQGGRIQGQRKPKVRPEKTKQSGEKIIANNIRGITERKRAEAELRRNDLLIRQSRDIILFMRCDDGRILEVNEAALQAYGYTRDELLALTIGDLRAPTTRGLTSDQMAQANSVGILFETVHQRKDGSTFPVEVSSRGATAEGTRVLISVIRDITERKRGEESLRQSEERYRRLVETLPDGVIVHRQGRVVFANLASAKIGGAASPAELIGKPVMEFVHSDYRESALKRIQQLNEGVPAPLVEEKFIRLDGTPIDVGVTTIPFSYAGEPAILTVFNDITERKQAEYALRESEEKHRTLFETMAQGVVYQAADGKIISANPAAERILGLTLDQVQGRTSTAPRWKAIHEDGSDLPGDTHPSMVALATGKVVHGVVMGVFSPELEGYRWINIIAIPLFRLGETVPYKVYTTFEDITERKHAERALRESEERFRSILDNIEDGYFEVDTAGNFTFFNPALVRMLGRPANELMGMNNRLYMTPEGGKAVFQTFNRIFRTGIPEQAFNWDLVRPDGTLRSVEVSVSLIKAADGSIIGFRGTVRDITKRKRAEEEIKKQLDELQRWHNATLGRETRILDLKREVNELMGKAGQPPRYPSAET